MNLPKKVIFISHAAPEDNYLSRWLAAKLQLLGYEVWVDVKDLRTGTSFWNDIELVLRNHTIRFLAIVSKDYIDKSRDQNSGVFLEITLARNLSKNIDSFILPIKIDDSNYEDFPVNMLALDSIDFSQNWGAGLKNLVDELKIQDVPSSEPIMNALSLWYQYQNIRGTVIRRETYYGSNWFRYRQPSKIYIYQYTGDFRLLYDRIPFSFIRNRDYLIGFFDDIGLDIHFTFKEQVRTTEFVELEDFKLNNGDFIKDSRQKLVMLLNKSINDHFWNLDNFGVNKGANKKKIFYPKYDEGWNGRVSLRSFNKSGRKLYSVSSKYRWRYGVSFLFRLTPFPHLVANAHLVCTDDKGFLSNDEFVKARRSIPNEWYNRHWHERLLCFMLLASGMLEQHELFIPTGQDNIVVDIEPIGFTSKFGYEENI